MKRRCCYNFLLLVMLAFTVYLNIQIFFGKNVKLLDTIYDAMNRMKYFDASSAQRVRKKESSGFERRRIPQCTKHSKPKNSILYIKVHKTGSTTLRSTLLVYGQKYNLTICMDATNLWGLNWPYRVDDEKLTKLYDEKCDLVAEEMVFNKKIVKRLFNDDAFIMASVRYPVDHFMSLYKYTGLQKAVERLVNKKLGLWDGMRVFLRYPTLVKNIYATYKDNEVRDKLQANLIRPNLQLYSLGVAFNNTEEILRRTAEIDFFVVAEHFDKSMVILKEKLCCSLQDVLYRRQNIRQTKEERQQRVPSDIKNAILNYNKGDLILYNKALKQLIQDKQAFENFDKKLEEFRNELSLYEQQCSEKGNACPPNTNGQVGVFVEEIRKEQREKLLSKLRKMYKSD